MRKLFRLVAAAAALAVATLGLAAPAMADVNSATIDPGLNKTLTIHKYEAPTWNQTDCPADGSVLPATCTAGKTGLEGAEFTIYKVMDLNTNADWEAAKVLYDAGVWNTAGKTGDVVTTGATGTVTYDPAGTGSALYYVVETKTPTGYTGAVPFFVTLPMTNVTNDGWNYAVQVYPKNIKQDAPHKAVYDDETISYEVGDEVDYRVSVVIPTYNDVVGPPAGTPAVYTAPDGTINGWDVGSYYVWDKFSTDLTDLAVSSVRIFPEGEDPTTYTGVDIITLEENTHYVVQKMGQIVQVSLIGPGLDALANNQGSQLVVDYSTTILTIPVDGTIENTAYVVPGSTPAQGGTPPTPPTPDTPPTEEPPGTPTNEVISKFGKIRIEKRGVTGTDTTDALAGATFEVYAAVGTQNTATGVWTYSCARDVLAGTQVLDTFTTTAGGAGESNVMLRLSTWYNDGVEKAAGGNNDGYLDGAQYAEKYGYRTYCLVETVAPEGYQLLAQPVEFLLDEVGATTTVDTKWQEVVNQADNVGNNLPLTGGQGIAAMSIVGLLLIGGGVAYYSATSRKRKVEVEA